MRLFVPRNNERMISKEKRKKEPRDRIFTQPSKYFSILKILQYDYELLSLYTLLIYESLGSKRGPGAYCDSHSNGLPAHRTPAIVLSSKPIHPSYYLTRYYPATDH